jgi:hypothetical protein
LPVRYRPSNRQFGSIVRQASDRPLPHPADPDRLVPCADHTESADRARCIGTAPGEFPFRQFLPLLH